jgi:hypothetical protein
MDQCPGGTGPCLECVVTVHVNSYCSPVANKKLPVAAGGVQKTLARAGDDPMHQRPGNLRRREELAKSLL